MNRQEALLLQVAEEASEVSQAASKCLRFGITHTWPTKYGEQARERLYKEFLECRALVEMCQDEGLIQACDDVADRAVIEGKKVRVEEYLLLSRQLGTVQ